jgi:argininosuccinate synthase
VRLKLCKGNIITVGRKSPLSLYRPDIATMESGESIYDQSDATGFIKINALRLRVEAMVQGQAAKGGKKPSAKKSGRKNGDESDSSYPGPA